jgi:hypothetical protein
MEILQLASFCVLLVLIGCSKNTQPIDQKMADCAFINEANKLGFIANRVNSDITAFEDGFGFYQIRGKAFQKVNNSTRVYHIKMHFSGYDIVSVEIDYYSLETVPSL